MSLMSQKAKSDKNLWAIDFVDKYSMKLDLLERFKATIATDPRYAKMRARQTFKAAATVEIVTDDIHIIEQANDYSVSCSMTKLVRRGGNVRTRIRWWEFEDEQDAIQFQMNMGGKLFLNYDIRI
jgi:hypothetical protein